MSEEISLGYNGTDLRHVKTVTEEAAGAVMPFRGDLAGERISSMNPCLSKDSLQGLLRPTICHIDIGCECIACSLV